jgi:hypothetical protein
MTQPSRIELARQRLKIARRAIGVTAVAGFVAFAVAARASHPGSHAASSPSTSTSEDSSVTSSSTFVFGRASIAPSTGGGGAVQSGGS